MPKTRSRVARRAPRDAKNSRQNGADGLQRRTMPDQQHEVAPWPHPRQVRTAAGQTLTAPPDWELLPPGDAALTRRVKDAGPCWVVTEKRGRKVLARGVWAPAARIAAIRTALAAERADPAYGKRLAAGRARRAAAQEEYADDFELAVRQFLAFAPRYAELGQRVALAIAAHATPVGSGTVARTQRIPIEERAEAATIAWLRHQTTGYDEMRVARVKGKRREVRRLLAHVSRELLQKYRRGEALVGACRLTAALAKAEPPPAAETQQG